MTVATEGTLPTPGLVLVIVAVAVVALLAGGARMERITRIPALGALLHGGWVYCALGACLGPLGADVIDGARLAALQPLVACLLALIGLIAGLQCSPAILRAIPTRLVVWVARDLGLSVVIGLLAVAILARTLLGTLSLDGDARTPGVLLLVASLSTLAAATCGWAPESRTLAISAHPRAVRLAVLIQAGAGLAALCAIAMSSLAVVPMDPLPGGGMAPAPMFGAPVLVATAIASLVVTAVAWVLMRDASRDDASAMVTLFGALALVAGTATAATASPLLAGTLLGVCLAQAGGRATRLLTLSQASEPVAAAGLFLLAGTQLQLDHGPAVVIAALALALGRRALKPTSLARSLRTEAESLAIESPLSRATTRQSPMAIAIALTASTVLPAPAGQTVLGVIVLAGAASWVLAVFPRPARALRTERTEAAP